MGNCVLRDMGFDLEKDEEKRRQMEEYLKEKLATKYPDAYRIEKGKSAELDNNKNKGGSRFAVQDDDEEDLTNGRLSRMVRKKKKVKQMIVQTAEGQEDKYSPSAVSNFSGVKNTRHAHKLSSDTTESRNLGENDSPDKVGSSSTDLKQGDNLSKSGTPLRGGRFNSDNSGPLRVSALGGGPKTNLFDGIERINFNENNGRMAKFSTGRAKHPMIKGFENKYFRVSRQRSPSANEDDEKLFDDEDEEEDFPYDYNH